MPKFEAPKNIPSEQLQAMQTMMESLWPLPADLPTVKETRQHLARELFDAVAPAVWEVWRHEIPADKEKAVARQVKRGIRESLDNLRSKDAMLLWFWPQMLPPYWEPPMHPTEPEDEPPHRLQMYRLTAALIALSIRNSLEDFHAEYTADEHMPRLNRAIRDAVYGVLLANPGCTWNIGLPARASILAARMGMPNAELPPVAGNGAQ